LEVKSEKHCTRHVKTKRIEPAGPAGMRFVAPFSIPYETPPLLSVNLASILLIFSYLAVFTAGTFDNADESLLGQVRQQQQVLQRLSVSFYVLCLSELVTHNESSIKLFYWMKT